MSRVTKRLISQGIENLGAQSSRVLGGQLRRGSEPWWTEEVVNRIWELDPFRIEDQRGCCRECRGPRG